MNSPSSTVIKRLFAVSKNKCGFPMCNTPIVDEKTGTVLGEICHINALSEGGMRFDPTQTDEQRNGFDNLILLCPTHHKLIDTDPAYTTDKLRKFKLEKFSKFSYKRTSVLQYQEEKEIFEKHLMEFEKHLMEKEKTLNTTNTLTHEFDVALSFAGENRQYVEAVANELKRVGVRVFYDKFETAKLWGKDLYVYLQDIYQNKAQYTIMFISEHYAKKLWTSHERKMAQARAFTESKEYILPAQFDDTKIEGIPTTTGYIDLRYYTPKEFSKLVCEKLEVIYQEENSTETNESQSRVNKIFTPHQIRPETEYYLEFENPGKGVEFLRALFAGKIISKSETTGLRDDAVITVIDPYTKEDIISFAAQHRVKLKDITTIIPKHKYNIRVGTPQLTFTQIRKKEGKQYNDNLISTWFKKYLNETINILEKTSIIYSSKRFSIEKLPMGETDINVSQVKLFDFDEWNQLNSTLTAQQFLKTFPDIKWELESFLSIVKTLDLEVEKLIEVISLSPEFERQVRANYKNIVSSRGYPENEFHTKDFNTVLQYYVQYWLTQYYHQIDTYQPELKKLFAVMKIYSLLDLSLEFPFPDVIIFNTSKDNLYEAFNESKNEVDASIGKIKELINNISQKAKSLVNELDEFRFDFAMDYNIALE